MLYTTMLLGILLLAIFAPLVFCSREPAKAEVVTSTTEDEVEEVVDAPEAEPEVDEVAEPEYDDEEPKDDLE